MNGILGALFGEGALWQVLVLILPFVLPNRTVYLFGKKTIGLALRALTLSWVKGKKGIMPLVTYVFDTIVAFLEGIVDGIRNAPDSGKYKKVKEG